MLRTFVIALVCLAFGCTSQPQRPPVLTNAAQLDAHVGELVTIRGEFMNTKIPTIIGVDVRSYNPDLHGQQAEATGVLQRWVVTPEEIDGGPNRGPGVFYRLKDQATNDTAAVRPVSP